MDKNTTITRPAPAQQTRSTTLPSTPRPGASLQRTQINTKEGGRSEVFGRSHGRLLVLSLDHLVMLAALQIISQLRVVGVGGALPGSLPLKETSRALRKPTGSTVSSVTSTVTFQ